MAELTEILSERGGRYGSFAENAAISQNLKAVMKFSRNWEGLTLDKKECLEMIAAKISRLLTGETEHADTFLDIAGYATLVAQNIQSSSSSSEVQSPST